MQITIVNNIDFPIWYVYISPSTNNDWGPDLVDDDQIIDNEEFVTFDLPSPGVEQYNIMFDDIDIWRYLR